MQLTMRRMAWISIHVPREGDDVGFGAPMLEANLISIHVPREGDDHLFRPFRGASGNFNPRPP